MSGDSSFDPSALGATGNSFGFDSGLGNIDPSSGLNSLNGGLVGPGAGTIPNGFLGSASNFIPSGSGVSAGALNGNTSFAMPAGNSMLQLASQALGLGAGAAKEGTVPGPSQQTPLPRSGPTQHIQAVEFSAPIQNFAGSQSGSQSGNSLLQLLAKYRPGSSL